MFNDFLFEIGCEELPSGAVRPLAEALAQNIEQGLQKEDLTYGKVHCFATPRRLAVFIEKVQTQQATKLVSRRGPSCAGTQNENGQPTPALLGFAKSCGVSIEELKIEKTEKGEWWLCEKEVPGMETIARLPELVNEAVAKLPIAKLMRWGEGTFEFARPVHWIVLLFGEQIVSAKVLGVQSGNQSFGHRFHHPHAIEITSPALYASTLKEAFVIADFEERKALIKHQVEKVAEKAATTPIMPDVLLEEVTSIVEWPQALLANFEEKFLNVPAEALIAAMQIHQKCFALRDRDHNLAPHFITVSNIASTDERRVVEGNEKVMRARLSDADFFFRQDKKTPLATYQEATKTVIFQKGLGSLYDKAQRLSAFVVHFAPEWKLDQGMADKAAQLSKCDLMTGMVGEFPELQGLMGYYYALHAQENKVVADALFEQYLPRFAGDELPKTPLGAALSLADRFDTLLGNFALEQIPTGTKDPFKLRRHALAIVRILLHSNIQVNLSALLEQTQHIYGNLIPHSSEVVSKVKTFILERAQSFYQGQQIATDAVHAVFKRQDECLPDIDARLHALVTFMQLPEAESLSSACKRVNNLLQQAAVNDYQSVDEALLIESAEKNLWEKIKEVEVEIQPLYAEREYSEILTALATMKEPVDVFFDKVMVMVEEPKVRENRLCVLGRLQELLQGVADISQLQFS